MSALALAAVFTTAYRLAFQDRMLGDGAGLATFFARGDSYAHHFLYLPACRFVAVFTPGDDPIGPAKLLSALAAGVGIGLTYLAARAFGAARFGALTATLLLALAPGLVFFGTTVEVHALHFLAVSLAAWAMLGLPWRRPAVALPLAGALAGVCFWGHQLSVLLGPGWVYVAQLARSRRAEPFATRTLLLVVGPVLLLGILASSALANYLRAGSLLPSASEELGILTAFQRPPEAMMFFWDGWLLPLALLLPLAGFAFAMGEMERRAQRALFVLILLPTAFLFWWGVSERGGYVLGHAPFLVALCALAFREVTKRAVALAATMLVVQGAASWWFVTDWDRGWKVEERVELVREHLGEEGLFVAAVDNAPSIEIYLPGVREVSLWDTVGRAYTEEMSPREFVDWYLPQVRTLLATTGGALVELGFEGQEDRSIVAARLEYYRPLVAALREEYATKRIEHPWWPMLWVERRDG